MNFNGFKISKSTIKYIDKKKYHSEIQAIVLSELP